MSPLRLGSALRRELSGRFAERPWPPPPQSDDDALLALAARRILDELADEPPSGFPDCADWVLLVPEERAAALRSEPIDARLLVAGAEQWTALDEDLRESTLDAAALLQLRLAGVTPEDWAALLPGTAPDATELAATLGEDAPAVFATLRAPGFGALDLLQVFTLGPDGPQHCPDLSGVLAVRSGEG